jgi:uncharacterized membrane protein YeiH
MTSVARLARKILRGYVMSEIIEWYRDLAQTIGRDPFNLLLEYIGTFAGAISGIRLASVKRFDWFGAYVVGFVTALGGGTIRDAMLNIPPFWMTHPSYLATTFVALVAVSVFGRRFISERITWFVFDTISISLFTVIGLEKTLSFGFPSWCAIIMGVVTAVFGGVSRDVLINEVPLIFRKEIYATACFVGAVLYVVMSDVFGVAPIVCASVCMIVIFILRALAIRFSWSVPVLKGRPLHMRRDDSK